MAHILVVDDEELIRATFREFLERAGYEVVTAGSFQEACQRFESVEYDLIYTDIHLGGQTGLELLKEIRKRNLPSYVVVITGFPNLETAQEALRLGAFDYISKPILMESLLRSADRALEHKRLRDEKDSLRRHLETVFRSVQDGIVTVNSDFSITTANESAMRLCPHLSVGEEVERGGLPLCENTCRKVLNQVFKDRRPVELHRLPCPGGERERVLTVRGAPLLDDREIFSGAVLVLQDETRINELERDLKQRSIFHGIVGSSPGMQLVFRLIEDLANVDTTVLVTGESGTGKELVAEALHYQGRRGAGHLVAVNCAGLPDSLLESELFGHVRGAFTGAIRDKVGRFQLADKGTIFLDEIGDISPAMQTRLLRVLQEKRFERVGDSRTMEVDVRVVAATNQDLRQKVAARQFREDLYYRLKVVEIHLPPLRERRADIPMLCDHFIRRLNMKFNKNIEGMDDSVVRLFMNYNWQGNIRELEHALEHAFVVCRTSHLGPEDLPPEFKAMRSGLTSSPMEVLPERDSILHALDRSGWVKAKAARILGVSRSTLYRRLRELGIEDLETEP